VSGVHHEQNARIVHQDYPDLSITIEYLHRLGFTVRLCLMMHRQGVCTVEGLWDVVEFCRNHGVEQLTARSIRKPEHVYNKAAADFVNLNGLTDADVAEIHADVARNGDQIMKLDHGAVVYDIGGQNLCMSDCLTLPKDENLRQLIFYSDGRLAYDWQYQGAVLLGGNRSSDA